MKPTDSADARRIGLCLGETRTPVRHLLTEAQRLVEMQTCLRQWAARPASNSSTAFAASLRIVRESEGELVIHADSATALVALRYRQEELLTYLRQRFPISAVKITTRIVPRPGSGVEGAGV